MEGGTQTEIKQEEVQVASLGKVQRVEMNITPQEEKEIATEGSKEEDLEGKKGEEVVVGKEKEGAETQTGENEGEEEVELTEAQKKAFFKKFGVEYKSDEDFDTIKDKLKPSGTELTEEEKKAKASAYELKMADLYVKRGGTLEQLNTIKQIANADPAEFSKKAAVLELVEAGFTEEEASNIAKEMYYQIQLDNISQDEDEDDEEFEKRKKFLERKVGFGAKKLGTQASYIQKQAAEVLEGLRDALKSEELRAQEEENFLSNVDKSLKAFSRKQTYELGKVNDQEIAPVLHEVSEDSVKSAEDILRDPIKRNNFFYNKDNTLNLDNVIPLLVNDFERQRSIKGALLEGESRQRAEFEKVFPAKSPYDLGVGGAQPKNDKKGVATSYGKRQVVMPTFNN